MSQIKRSDQERKMIQEGRLPPGQSLTTRFPVLHYGPVQRIHPENWDFHVWGQVETPVSWTWSEFHQLPRTQVVLDVHCVTRWSQFDTLWEGVAVRTLVEEGFITLTPHAHYVIQHAEGGYTTNLPLDIVLQENFLLATHYGCVPLTPEHGYPLRAVIGAIPGRVNLKTPYFWKGAKWLRSLEFSSEDKPGFWERAGYHNDADVWKEERTVGRW
ncbi:MAG: sulfite oxidase-like oxidoreductase [Clostridia bacterium]|nr:MAG: sulfite oxidase-like oxidoreductase [Clostridia bacterium]